MLVAGRHLVRELHLEPVAAFLRALDQHVGQRHQAGALIGEQHLSGGFRAAPAAADQSDTDDVAAEDVGGVGNAEAGGGGFHKLAA